MATAPQSLFYFLEGQVRYMKRKGVEVHGVSSPGKLLGMFAQRERAVVHEIDMPRAISPVEDLIAIWCLYRLFRRLRPDIVHAHTPKGGLLGMIAAILACVPTRIYNVHGLPYMTATGVKRRLLQITEKISITLAHQVFCVSASLADQICEEKFCRKKKICVFHKGSINGVDALNRFDPTRYNTSEIRNSIGIPQKARVIGFVGRIVRDKGILELAASWFDLRERFSDLHLLIIGPFEKKDAIPRAVRQRLLSDERIHLMGHVKSTAPFYSAMDILAFPTHREGFGIVAIEAAAMCVPVVATRIPGCIDSVVDGETGILVPSKNTDALTEALSAYLNDSKLRRKHGEAGRRRAKVDFRPNTIWTLLHTEYLNLMSG